MKYLSIIFFIFLFSCGSAKIETTREVVSIHKDSIDIKGNPKVNYKFNDNFLQKYFIAKFDTTIERYVPTVKGQSKKKIDSVSWTYDSQLNDFWLKYTSTPDTIFLERETKITEKQNDVLDYIQRFFIYLIILAVIFLIIKFVK